NDYIGYLPDTRAFELGGYQTWTGLHSFDDRDTGERMVDAAVAMLEELAEKEGGGAARDGPAPSSGSASGRPRTARASDSYSSESGAWWGLSGNRSPVSSGSCGKTARPVPSTTPTSGCCGGASTLLQPGPARDRVALEGGRGRGRAARPDPERPGGP